MSFDHEAFWSARYRDAGDDYLFGTAPNKFLASQAAYFGAGMSVLAVADGEGRNSVWLAEQGCAVTATEISPVALEKAAKLARGRHVATKEAIQLALGSTSCRRIFSTGLAERGLRCRGRHFHPVCRAGRAGAAVGGHEAGGETRRAAVSAGLYAEATGISDRRSVSCGKPLYRERCCGKCSPIGKSCCCTNTKI